MPAIGQPHKLRDHACSYRRKLARRSVKGKDSRRDSSVPAHQLRTSPSNPHSLRSGVGMKNILQSRLMICLATKRMTDGRSSQYSSIRLFQEKIVTQASSNIVEI